MRIEEPLQIIQFETIQRVFCIVKSALRFLTSPYSFQYCYMKHHLLSQKKFRAETLVLTKYIPDFDQQVSL